MCIVQYNRHIALLRDVLITRLVGNLDSVLIVLFTQSIFYRDLPFTAAVCSSRIFMPVNLELNFCTRLSLSGEDGVSDVGDVITFVTRVRH